MNQSTVKTVGRGYVQTINLPVFYVHQATGTKL